MNLELKDKVAIVTGGAKGIGEAITRTFAAEGAVACLFGRNRTEADDLVRELAAHGQRAESYFCEMTDEAQVRAAVAQVLAQHGRVDVVVNNAGVNDGVGLRAPVTVPPLGTPENQARHSSGGVPPPSAKGAQRAMSLWDIGAETAPLLSRASAFRHP